MNKTQIEKIIKKMEGQVNDTWLGKVEEMLKKYRPGSTMNNEDYSIWIYEKSICKEGNNWIKFLHVELCGGHREPSLHFSVELV